MARRRKNEAQGALALDRKPAPSRALAIVEAFKIAHSPERKARRARGLSALRTQYHAVLDRQCLAAGKPERFALVQRHPGVLSSPHAPVAASGRMTFTAPSAGTYHLARLAILTPSSPRPT